MRGSGGRPRKGIMGSLPANWRVEHPSAVSFTSGSVQAAGGSSSGGHDTFSRK